MFEQMKKNHQIIIIVVEITEAIMDLIQRYMISIKSSIVV